MAVEITMPQLSDTMSEGKILTWNKKEGDTVKRGEALAEVATDKADLEIESFHQGQLLKIFAPAGETVKVGSVIAIIGEAGESVAAPSASNTAPKAAPVAVAPALAPTPAPVAAAPIAAASEERVKISPLAKNIATAQGIDYTSLKGSGEGGRIVRRDVEQVIGQEQKLVPFTGAQVAHAPAPHAAPTPVRAFAAQSQASTEDLSKMRQTIASRMVESKTTIPHFYMTTKVEVGALVKMKESLKPLPQYEGLTVNHLIIKASALALRAFPRVNAAYVDGRLHQPQDVNVGIVTAVPDGLMIPVVKQADQIHLADLVSDARGLVQRTRSGRPKADDLVGGTFSISNVGNFPVESFSAIISPGQGAILAVGGISEEVLIIDGAMKVGSVMRITLSVDHRIIDGVLAGEFLKEMKRLLEDPVLLLA